MPESSHAETAQLVLDTRNERRTTWFVLQIVEPPVDGKLVPNDTGKHQLEIYPFRVRHRRWSTAFRIMKK